MITYVTPTGAKNGNGDAVNATATFTTSKDTVKVELSNLLVNQKSVGQNISDLLFTISTGEKTGSISSSSAIYRSVAGDGSYIDSLPGAVTGWALSTVGPSLYLDALVAAPPDQTILGSPDGSNVYSNANPSIAGNGPHNPFLFGPVTFTLSVLGVTDASTISAATFSFGTEHGDNVPGVPSDTPGVPEPASILMGLTAVAGLGGFAGWRRRRQA
ncbi:MAG: PEP-CTERM sorting domain-containing protein [Gemmataceae bacterium]